MKNLPPGSCRRRSSAATVLFAVVTALGTPMTLTGCGDSGLPSGDTTPPEAEISLSIGRWNATCPLVVWFNINPMGSTDDVTDRDALKVRWDFDNDGTWDTGYEQISLREHEPNPLPIGFWSVRCEVSDQAGNASVVADTIPLPTWLPEPPDIVAGDLTVFLPGDFGAPMDTLTVGQGFDLSINRRDWLVPGGETIRLEIRFDGVRTRDLWSATHYPHFRHCESVGVYLDAGFATPGLHEISCVIDADDDLAETDESNNLAVRGIVVVPR